MLCNLIWCDGRCSGLICVYLAGRIPLAQRHASKCASSLGVWMHIFVFSFVVYSESISLFSGHVHKQRDESSFSRPHRKQVEARASEAEFLIMATLHLAPVIIFSSVALLACCSGLRMDLTSPSVVSISIPSWIPCPLWWSFALW